MKNVSIIRRVLIGITDVIFLVIPVHSITHYLKYGTKTPPTSKEIMLSQLKEQGLGEADFEMVSNIVPNIEQIFIQMDFVSGYLPSWEDIVIIFILFNMMWFLSNGKSIGLLLFRSKIVNMNDDELKLSFLTTLKRTWFTLLSFVFSMGILQLPFYSKFTRNYADSNSSTKIVSL